MINKNINDIVNNARNAYSSLPKQGVKPIIEHFKTILYDNFALLEQANQIDLKNDNGFVIEQKTINRIFANNLAEESIVEINNNTKLTEDNLAYYKGYYPVGVVAALFNGDCYLLLDLIIKSIMTHNALIIVNNGYLLGTNEFIIQTIQNILMQFNDDKFLVQGYVANDFEVVFANFKSIDLILLIGNSDFQNQLLAKSKTKTIVSGYNCFDIYLEELSDQALIEQILKQPLAINVYVNNSLNIDFEGAIYVNDLDEAINQINYNTAGYSCSIFTKDKAHIAQFLKEVKAKNVFANISPTVERKMDFNQSDLVREKTIGLPINYKIDSEQDSK